jgi:hypothetical protein
MGRKFLVSVYRSKPTEMKFIFFFRVAHNHFPSTTLLSGFLCDSSIHCCMIVAFILYSVILSRASFIYVPQYAVSMMEHYDYFISGSQMHRKLSLWGQMWLMA